jgi:hypothetical protein
MSVMISASREERAGADEVPGMLSVLIRPPVAPRNGL